HRVSVPAVGGVLPERLAGGRLPAAQDRVGGDEAPAVRGERGRALAAGERVPVPAGPHVEGAEAAVVAEQEQASVGAEGPQLEGRPGPGLPRRPALPGGRVPHLDAVAAVARQPYGQSVAVWAEQGRREHA